MLTLTLQSVSAALALVFGLLALAVSRHAYALTPDRLAGWRLTALGFGLIGASAVVQGAAAVLAFVAGAGSPFYEAYLRAAPAGNLSRFALGTAYAVALVLPAWSGRSPGPRFRRAAPVAMLLAMAAGGAAGWAEGAYDIGTHGVSASVFLAVEVIAFATALLVSAARGTFDLFLFAALMLYTLMMALSVPLLTGMSLGEALVGDARTPWLLHLQAVLFQAGMVGVAGLRLHLLRRGVRVAEVFGREPPILPRLFD